MWSLTARAQQSEKTKSFSLRLQELGCPSNCEAASTPGALVVERDVSREVRIIHEFRIADGLVNTGDGADDRS